MPSGVSNNLVAIEAGEKDSTELGGYSYEIFLVD